MTKSFIPHLESELGLTPDEKMALASLEPRLGHTYVVQRLRREAEYEAQSLHERTQLFNREHWLSNPALIRGGLRLLGLHARARRNALAIEVRHHEVRLPDLPDAFDGFVLLHLADLHFGMNDQFLDALLQRIEPLRYDLCVLTGDYRALTYGPYKEALEGLERLRVLIKGPAYAILGNHDTIRMVPAMERIGYQLLLNEATSLALGNEAIYLAGVDDANFYRMAHIDQAAHDIPAEAVSILLSHTPETYRQAADATFDLMLCGHTHGGQICLPGGIPIRTEATSPRRLVKGSWRYGRMIGYTSTGAGTCIVDARLNCPPEVTLHRLRRGPASIREGASKGTVADLQPEQNRGQDKFQHDECDDENSDVVARQVELLLDNQKRQQGLGDLIQPESLGMQWQVKAPFHKAGEEIPQHGRACNYSPYAPVQMQQDC